MIILVGSSKGGCGKSTIATNLAAVAAHKGRDVVLLDADSQRTSSTWATDREETNAPNVVCVQRLGDIAATAKELATKYDLVIIDAPGHDSPELKSGLLAANLLITPFKPSQADLDTVFHLCDVISRAKDFNTSLQAVAVLTMSPTHPANTEIQVSRDYLSEHITVLDCLLHDRKVYRDALSMGYGVIEQRDPKAKNEINELYKVISNA